MTSNPYQDLNPEQLEAVKAVNGPVIVFAGAGTGKTKTLTTRIAYMINEMNILANHILAITFTKKATNEMRERILSSVGINAGGVFISTIHSLCAYILRRHIEHLGYRRDFEIIDDEEMLKIINEIFKAENYSRKSLTPKAALNLISSYKNGLGKLYGLLEKVYQKYQQYLIKNNMVDFDDLLLLTYQLLNENVDVLEFYRYRFQYILVDEFQDTNRTQYDIIKLLSNPKQNIFVVGDDDQSIYSFRGACVDNMYHFMADFDHVKIIKLVQNYRSSNAILKGANTLIANNKIREPKELFSTKQGNYCDIIVNEAYYFEDEARYVASEIKKLVRQGYQYSKIAVLYRNNVISRNFELAMIEHRIPYTIYGGFSYLKRREIKDVISYLRFILNENSFYHFKRIINQPSRGIGEKTIQRVQEFMEENNVSLYDAIDSINKINPSTKNNMLVDFKRMIQEFKAVINDMDLPTFFDLLMEKTGYLEMIKAEDDVEINRLGNLEEFKSILVKIESSYEEEDLTRAELLQRSFDEVILDETLGSNDNKKGVVLSTIHSIKGLEFDVVFVTALEEGIFPAIRDEVDIEEERRVAYVACTRAKEKIYLTCATRRLIYGRIVKNSKSRFLTEYLNCHELKKVIEDAVLESAPGEIKPSDRIYHSNFGYGIVISVEQKTIQVLFEKDQSLKKILKDHPAIKKC